MFLLVTYFAETHTDNAIMAGHRKQQQMFSSHSTEVKR